MSEQKVEFSDANGQVQKGPDCLAGEIISSFIDGDVGDEQARVVRAHLDECEACRKKCTMIAALKMGAERSEAREAQLGLRKKSNLIAVALLCILGVALASLFIMAGK